MCCAYKRFDMDHILSVYVGAQYKTKKIGGECFVRAHQAIEILKAQHAIEARFQNLLNNYVSFESSLAHLLISHTLHPDTIFDPTDETHAEIARHLSNFLSAGGGYKNECVRQRSIGDKARLLFNEAKKLSSNFGIAEELRNYDQHFSLLVNQFSLPSAWTDDLSKRRHGIALALSLPRFVRGVRSTSQALRDLKLLVDSDGNVQLLPITRKYIEDLSGIHHEIRELLKSDFEFAKLAINEVTESAIAMGAKTTSPIQISSSFEDGVLWVTNNLVVSIEALRKQNSVPRPKFGLVEFFF
jgi:hypothetical protein